MRLLFVHQNFPGQYKHLAPALAAQGHEVHALAINHQPGLPGVKLHLYKVARGSSRNIHPWALETETKVLRGEACARAALALKAQGFTPDVICAHPGWGEALFLREVWPAARQLHYVEFFYSAVGQDVGFDPEFDQPDFDDGCRIRMKNANTLLNLETMDRGICPTRWQLSTVPELFRGSIEVIHDGVDTLLARPDPAADFAWRGADGTESRVLKGDQVLTFVNRNLEPSRGYHVFMRALPQLLDRHPKLQVLIVGGGGVSYGAQPAEGGYKERFLAEVQDRLDLARVHFLGHLPYSRFLRLLQVSAVHVYLTYPFVLSWSMLEAMSAGCLVIGSRTPPVEEVIVDGENGLLVDFFAADKLASAVSRVLDDPASFDALRANARRTIVERYDLKTLCLPRQMALVEAVHRGE
ncbi:glycosyltransferase family 4 protein [Ramlibacter sp. 2FC]|uniref:glycosyltransferase family 4 protein n=1 Tax=Ramlibacter sp. 2FC TaxID=2502188 RepID=UPI0010F4BE81|nr:glycosyltransferase family 4 protein [Ramlibacter sp. 2FC]